MLLIAHWRIENGTAEQNKKLQFKAQKHRLEEMQKTMQSKIIYYDIKKNTYKRKKCEYSNN